MRFQSEWLAKGLVESIFVVASILLALGVDEWAENQRYEEIADQSLAIFEQELTQNRARLEDVTPFHQGLHDLLGQMQYTAAGPAVDVRSIMEGVQQPVLLSTAWQTAVATGALTHMDFDIVSALSLTYSIQERFSSRPGKPRLIGASSLTSDQAREQVQEALDYVGALTEDESELTSIYQEALQVIRAHRDDATVTSPDSSIS